MDLASGEKVYKKTSPSRRSTLCIKFYLLAVIFLFLGVSVLLGLISTPVLVLGGRNIFYDAGFAMIALSFLFIVYGEIKRKYRGTYIITNLRLIVKRGFIKTHVDSVTNKMIVNVKASQSLWQKLLGIGDVDITTSRGDKEIELSDIAGAKDVENLIYKLMETRGAEAPWEAQAPAAAPPQQPPEGGEEKK